MPPKTRKYKLGNSYYDVPEDRVSAFISSNPDATIVVEKKKSGGDVSGGTASPSPSPVGATKATPWISPLLNDSKVPKERTAGFKTAMQTMDYDQLTTSVATAEEALKTPSFRGLDTGLGGFAERTFRAARNRQDFKASAPYKVNELLNNLDKITERDLKYIETTAPIVFGQLKATYAPKAKTLGEAAATVKNAVTESYKASRIQSAMSGFKSSVENAKAIGFDPAAFEQSVKNNQGEQYLVRLRDTALQQREKALKDLDAKYPATPELTKQTFGGAPSQVIERRNPAYFEEREALLSQYDDVAASLATIGSTVAAKKNKYTARDIGRMYYKIANIDLVEKDKLAEGTSETLNAAFEWEGLKAQMATGDEVLMEAAEQDMRAFDDKHPGPKRVEVMHRLSAELNRDTPWYAATRQPTTADLDRASEQLTSTDREFYQKHIRNWYDRRLNSAFSPGLPQVGANKFLQGMGEAISPMYEMFDDRKTAARKALDASIDNPGAESVGKYAPAVLRLASLRDKEKTVGLSALERTEKDDLLTYTETRSGFQNTADLMFGVTGNVAGFLALSAIGNAGITGALGRVGLLAAPRAAMVGASLEESMAAAAVNFGVGSKFIQASSTVLSGAMMSYPDSKRMSLMLFPGESEGLKRSIFTTAVTTATAFSELIFNDRKAVQALMPQLTPVVANIVNRLTAQNLSQEVFKKELLKAYLKAAGSLIGRGGIETTKEMLEEQAPKMVEAISVAIMAPEKFNDQKYGEQMKEIFTTMMVGGLPVGMLAGYHSHRQNRLAVPTIAQLGRNRTLTTNVLHMIGKMEASGDITPAQATEKRDIIKKLKDANAGTDLMIRHGMGDGKVTPKQFDKYVVMLANENLLRDQADATTDVVAKKAIETQIAESEKMREAIIEGSVYVNDDFGIETPEEAQANAQAEQQQDVALANDVIQMEAELAADATDDAVVPEAPAEVPEVPAFSYGEANGVHYVYNKAGKPVSVYLTKPEAEADLAWKLGAEAAGPIESTDYQKNRDAGQVTVDGVTYKRQDISPIPVGAVMQKTKFSDSEFEDTYLAIVELDGVQAAHTTTGQRNPMHFIGEGQPKERTDIVSQQASDNIANDPNFDEITQGVSAYVGAPTLNERREVIQGNNRFNGLLKHYNNGGTKYRSDLMAVASKYGKTADEVAAMKKPGLVRIAKVSDARAIELGNYDVKDTETGGNRRIDPVATSRKIPFAEKLAVVRNIIGNADETLKANIRSGWNRVVKLLAPKYISPSQLNSMADADGNLRPQAVDDIHELIKHFLFEGGDVRLPMVFDVLPHSIAQGIYKSMPAIFNTPAGAGIITEIQNAAILLYNVEQSRADSVQAYMAQNDAFDPNKRNKYSPADVALAIKLLELEAQDKPESKIRLFFRAYESLVNGANDMFEQRPALEKAAAMEQWLGVVPTPDAASVIETVTDLINTNEGENTGQDESPAAAGTDTEGAAADSETDDAEPEAGTDDADGAGEGEGVQGEVEVEAPAEGAVAVESTDGETGAAPVATPAPSADEAAPEQAPETPPVAPEEAPEVDADIAAATDELLRAMGMLQADGTILGTTGRTLRDMADQIERQKAAGITPLDPNSKRSTDLVGAITKLYKKVAGFKGVSILPKNEFAAKVDEGKGKGTFANTKGEIYGMEYKGVIYLDASLFNANTPVHEAGHIFIKWAKAMRPTLYKAGLEQGRKNPYYQWLKTNPSYKGVSEPVLAEEALMWAVGAMGNDMQVTPVLSWWGKLMQAVQEVIHGYKLDSPAQLDAYLNGYRLKKGIAIEKLSGKAIEKMTWDEFAYAFADRIISGKALKGRLDDTGQANAMAEGSNGMTTEQLAAGRKLVNLFVSKGVYKFEEIAAKVYDMIGAEKMAALFPALQQMYGSYYSTEASDADATKMDARVIKFTFENLKQKKDVPDRPGSSESNSGNAADGQQGNAKPVQSGRGNGGRTGSSTSKSSRRRASGQGVLDLFAPAIGTQSDSEIQGTEPGAGIERQDAGATDGRGDRLDGAAGYNGPDSTGNTTADTASKESTGASFAEQSRLKRIAQQNAESIAVKPMDEANIRATLPFLLPEQQDDVLKAENRFFGDEHKTPEKANGKGMLFTNGTGTGKTFTGLGIIKRFVKQGKQNILIVVPSQQKVEDWRKDGMNLDLEITPLPDTSTGGTGIVVTTYANFRSNDELLKRDFDLVVYDESHRLMESKKGEASSTSYIHYEASNKDEGTALSRITSRHPLWIEARKLNNERREHAISKNNLDSTVEQLAVLDDKIDAIDSRLEAIEKEQEELLPRFRDRAKKAYENTKVVFLSATPFKAHFNLRYANGFLFDWGGATTYQQASNTVSRVDAESRFFLDNFGSAYEWKYHQLQSKGDANPDAVAMQEMAFSEGLMKAGSLSGRVIESNQDYAREFPLVTGFNSEDFNKAFSAIFNYTENAFSELRPAAVEVFMDYNYTTQLFESLKAAMSTERIQQHLDLGRKVVVFHRRQQSNARPPFASILDQTRINAMAVQQDNNATGEQKVKATLALQQADAFFEKYADLLTYEQDLDYSSAVDQLKAAFGDRAAFFNGRVSQKEKSAAVKNFNTDGSGIDVLVVQEEAGKEGISLHDTTGQHQRVLISLSMPISTVTALQVEGRIYRIGQESDAIFEYPLLGLDLEVAYFGQNINKRMSTTENLAVGSASRDLIRSFAEGVLFNSNTNAPSREQGKGGKEYDKRQANTTTPFEKAKLIYATNQKIRGRRDQRAGVDYFATPEPLGQKMVEWADMRPGESAMEPSAGHGAIAMWVPTPVSLTAVEPSFELFSKLNGRAGGGSKKILNQNFEDFALVNKVDTIVMNPPFGASGKMAMDHIAKAFKHLRDGGRIVAIVPNGGAMAKRVDDFLYGQDEKGRQNNPDAHLRADIGLPSIAFAQAGTQVSTRVIVIDKISNTEGLNLMPTKTEVSAEKIGDFFDGIEDLEVPERVARQVAAQAETTPAPAAVALDPILQKPVEFTNTKTGAKMQLVKMGRYAGDAYNQFNTDAKKNNGFYSRFAGGFLFNTEADAQKFVESEGAGSGGNLMAMPANNSAVNGKNDNFGPYGKNKPGQADANTEQLLRSNIGAVVGEPEKRDGIYKTIQAGNAGGSVSPNFTTEELEELQSRGLNPYWSKRSFRSALESAAKKNGVFLDNSVLDGKTLIHDKTRDNTSENDLYLNSDGRVVTKINDLSYVTGNDVYNNLNAFIDRIASHNFLFPNSTYTFKGFALNSRGVISAVFEQPYIAAKGLALESQINNFLAENGFKKEKQRPWSNGHPVWTNGRYELFDARPANVLIGEDGSLFFVDTYSHSLEYLNSQASDGGNLMAMPDGRMVQTKPVLPDVVNGFYSPLEKMLGEAKADKLPAKQWGDRLNTDEAKWTGLKDWLAGQTGSVGKADIQQYLKDNRIEIKEVVKGGTKKVPLIVTQDTAGKYYVSNSETGEPVSMAYRDISRAEAILIDLEKSYEAPQTKFESYQLEGQKENYKEVLVTMPKKTDLESISLKVYGKKEEELTDNEFENIQKIRNERSNSQFRSSHFDEPNILVHLRMNTRTAADGSKVLFLEEIQSDWGQKGKKEGFGKINLKAKKSDDGRGYVVYNNDIRVNHFPFAKSEEQAIEFATEDGVVGNVTGVPQAPFVTDTNAWTKLGLKVALKEAVAQGVDKIAWTTGEQQNDRYDLSKQVRYLKIVEDEATGNYTIEGINAQPIGNTMLQEIAEDVPPNKLDDYVGKDIADRARKGYQEFEGEDLKVGGKGMKGFYGSPTEGSLGIVGNVAKSLFKQEPKTVEINRGTIDQPRTFEIRVDGEIIAYAGTEAVAEKRIKDNLQKLFPNSKFEVVKNKGETNTQHSITITPELAEQATAGQPMFMAGSYAPNTPEQKALKAQMDAATAEYQAARTAYDKKRKELMAGYKQSVVDLFGQTPAQRGAQQQLFDEKPNLIAAEKALAPFKIRLEKANAEANALYNKYMGLEGKESKQMAMFMVVGNKNANLNIPSLYNGKRIGENFNVAIAMEAQAESPEEIRLTTGWYKAGDAKWRYEITDADASLLKNPPQKGEAFKGTVGEYLNHPRLFEIYPRLKNVPLVVTNDKTNQYYGSYNPYTGIKANTKGDVEGTIAEILHEVQHAIQSISGLSRGADNTNIFEEKKAAFRRDNKREPTIYEEREMGAEANREYISTYGEIEAKGTQQNVLLSEQERVFYGTTKKRMQEAGISPSDVIFLPQDDAPMFMAGDGEISRDEANLMAAPANPNFNKLINAVQAKLAQGVNPSILQQALTNQYGPQMAGNIMTRAQRQQAAMPNNSILNNADYSNPNHRSAIEKGMNWWKRMFTSGEGQEAFFKELSDHARGESQWIIRKADVFLNKRLRPGFKSMDDTRKEGFMDMVRDLTAQTPAVAALTPEDIQLAKEFRQHIDDLTNEFVSSGWVKPDLAMTMLGNVGSYLNRSYKIFNDKDWTKNIPEQAKIDALVMIRDQHIVDGMPFAEAERKADQDLQRYLTEAAADANGFKALTTGGRDNSIFKNRQDIPEPIRRVLGEYTDPAELFMMTIARMAAARGQARYLQGLFDAGIGTVFFSEKDLNADPRATVKIADVGNEAWSPLNGLYTTPEVADYLKQATDQKNPFWQAYFKLGGFVKMGKTVFSPVTQSINALSNIGWYVANGYFLTSPVAQFGDGKAAVKLWWQNMFKTAGRLDRWNEKMVTLGLYDGSVGVADIRRMFASGDIDQIMQDAQNSVMAGVVGGAKRLMSDNWVIRNYALVDAISKLVGFRKESAGLAWALYGKDYDNLSPDEEADVDDQAAERVKNTQPTAQRAYKGAVWLSKNAFIIGNFITYQAESLRCARNVVAYALRDMRSPNKKIQLLGARRMAGIVTYMSLRGVILKQLSLLGGMAMSGIYSLFNDDDEEKKKRLAALNALGSEWLRSHDKYATKQADGTWKVYNVNALEPFGLVFKTMNAFTNGGEWVKEPGAMAAAAELISPFLENDMVSEALLNSFVKGENNYGRKLETPMEKIGNVAESLQPSFVPFLQRMFRNPDGSMADWGRIISNQDELSIEFDPMQLAGFRPYTVNPLGSFKRNAHKLLTSDSEKSLELYMMDKKLKAGALAADKYNADVLEIQAAQKAIGEQIATLIDHATALGVSEEEAKTIIKKLKEFKVLSKEAKKAALK